MKVILTIFLTISLLSLQPLHAQHKNDFEAGLFNIGFGGLIGGIGAVINKQPNQKFGNVFIKGVGQGALGGYLIFESKRLVGKFSETGSYAYVWPSKLVNAAGTSILENAAANRNFWEQWHINFGFNRFEFYTQDKFKITYRVMPFALCGAIYGFTQGRLSFNESLKAGTLVFKTDHISSNRDFDLAGGTISNSILLKNKLLVNRENVIAHELIHAYQYESFSGLNSFLDKLNKGLKSKSRFFNTYNKIFHTDFNRLSSQGLYSLNKNYNTNFFEKEARYYTK